MARTVEDDLGDDPSDLGTSLTGGGAGIPKGMIPQLDDHAKAGLVGFAVRMLSGGWGTGTQKFAGALGAGAESAAANEAYQQDIAEKDEARKSRETVAKIGATSKEEIARARDETQRAISTEKVAGALERAHVRAGGGARTNDELKYLMAAEARLTKTVKDNLKGLNLTPDQQAQWVRMKADEELAEKKAQGFFGGKGATPPGGKSKLGAPGSEEDAPAAAPPAATPKKGSKAAPSGEPIDYGPEGRPDPSAAWEAIKKNPKFDQAFTDPKERDKLRAKGYGPQVDAEETARGLKKPAAPSLIDTNKTPIADWLKKMMQGDKPGAEEGREDIK